MTPLRCWRGEAKAGFAPPPAAASVINPSILPIQPGLAEARLREVPP